MSPPSPHPSHPIRDTEVIARLRDGDATALDTLIRAYAPGLIRYAARTLNSADRAEEVVQEVFFEVWQERARLDPAWDIAAYLFGLTRRRALDALRSERRTIERESRWASDMARDISTTNTGDTNLAADELRAELWRALSDVPPRCREVFMVVWDRHLAYADVAKMFGITVPTVKNQMSRAFKHLARVLGKQFEDS